MMPLKDESEIGKDRQRNNDFDYSPDQEMCPFAAHTRKTKPRSDIRRKNDPDPDADGKRRSITRGGALAAFGWVVASDGVFRDPLWPRGHEGGGGGPCDDA